MKLEINKTYRCRNGAVVKIHAIAVDGTAYGRERPDGELISYNAYSGGTCVRERSGFDIIAPFQIDGPEMYHRFKTRYGREITVSETELTQAAHQVYEEEAPLCGPEPDRRRLLALAALRMIELAKVKPPSHPLPRHVKEDIERMCGPSSEPNSKAVAEQAARELANLLSDELSMSVNPILLRLWLVERWDRVAGLAHKIHDAK